MSEFHDFAVLVNRRLTQLIKEGEAYRTDVSKDDLWDAYLSSFPEGSNPVFRERTEHDCACCRRFIKNVGNLVTFDTDGNLQTVWDVEAEGVYAVVAQEMADAVRCGAVNRVFRVNEPKYGEEKNYEEIEGSDTITWHHFWSGKLPGRFVVDSVGAATGPLSSAHGVFKRGLEELSLSALEIVLDLIESDGLYRGAEHLGAVRAFAELKGLYEQVETSKRDAFVWQHIRADSVRFRNTVIGTLVVSISEGVDLAKAVGQYEAMVAPHNYKRSSAPITKGMVTKALGTLEELGIEDAVRRRFARISDVSPADVLFVDRSVSPLMKNPLADLLMPEAKVKPRTIKGSIEVTSEVFLRDILPGAETVSLQLERAHLSNFVSLTAPQEEDTGRLFKWGNDFAWTYDGDLADTDMRKAVRAAGGRVDGVFRFTHSWNHEKRNASLMDLHVFMPGSGMRPTNGKNDNYDVHSHHQHMSRVDGRVPRVGWNHRKHTASGGQQDVDYTEPAPIGYTPVENITFPDLRRMPEGDYICKIHNWRLRSPTEGGFRAEIEVGGQLYEYEYDKPLDNKEWVTVAVVTLKNGAFTVDHRLPQQAREVQKWGVSTGQLIPVDTIMLSPNYWGSEGPHSGNKHHIFMLRGCQNPSSVRGFFNEYLRSDLHAHRKVFEVLASKLKCEPTDDQLSGVGFSSTRHDSATFLVRKDGTQRTYTVQF